MLFLSSMSSPEISCLQENVENNANKIIIEDERRFFIVINIFLKQFFFAKIQNYVLKCKYCLEMSLMMQILVVNIEK